ncbi:MAG: N-acetylmuramoyl-L-alanine amidase [Magnetococcus sp. WYHC-3]
MKRRTLLKAMALTASGLWLPVSPAWTATHARITDIRRYTMADYTRVVFELSRPAEHSLFSLDNPARVVLDIEGAELTGNAPEDLATDAVIRSFRTGRPKSGTTRAVFELTSPVRPRSFLLPADGQNHARLVLDLFRRAMREAAEERASQAPAEAGAAPRSPASRPRRDKSVIVIDPGHGGNDPGAIGRDGTMEKEVVLEVAKRLQRRINATPGYQAHLTRDGDYFVPLKRRVALARDHEPDLFISLHADAFHDPSARGTSVYCLSERGKPAPSKAIRDLVQRENSADLIGGVNLNHVSDPEVAGILMDLSQRDSLNRGLLAGEKLLDSLREIPQQKIHFRSVKQAGFAVLKAPDVPSVLVELAFLSNPYEEAQLRRTTHQQRLADALFEGARGFVASVRQGAA